MREVVAAYLQLLRDIPYSSYHLVYGIFLCHKLKHMIKNSAKEKITVIDNSIFGKKNLTLEEIGMIALVNYVDNQKSLLDFENTGLEDDDYNLIVTNSMYQIKMIVNELIEKGFLYEQ